MRDRETSSSLSADPFITKGEKKEKRHVLTKERDDMEKKERE